MPKVTRPTSGLNGARANVRSKPHGSLIYGRNLQILSWWRGLDSNQRTLARADLQSAAFNHSATSPGCPRADHPGDGGAWTAGGAMWRAAVPLSTAAVAASLR